eukprot:11829.XXX_719259_719459_1 [CDS] Oithona nana genome sequencing.
MIHKTHVRHFFFARQFRTIDCSVSAFLFVVDHVFFHLDFFTSILFVLAKCWEFSHHHIKKFCFFFI